LAQKKAMLIEGDEMGFIATLKEGIEQYKNQYRIFNAEDIK
jgi:hypothetical protein